MPQTSSETSSVGDSTKFQTGEPTPGASSEAPALLARGLGLTRAGRPVLSDLDLQLVAGERLAIVGPSGAGKSTLLRLLAGLEAPEAGEILLENRLASEADRVLIPPHLRGMGLVFQSGALWPHMTVRQHLRFAAGRMPRAEREARIAPIVAACELTGLEARYPDQLSGGEQRRVGLARALAASPRWLLLDEPLVNLDPELALRLRQTIDAAASMAGLGLILVSHDRAEAEALCPRILRLEDGRLVSEQA
jgi:iron(III) transport system ATP-binding protein